MENDVSSLEISSGGECISDDQSEFIHTQSSSIQTSNSNARNGKVAKLDIENGLWNCSYIICSENDNNDMFVCRKCKNKWHYACTSLPDYQVALFLSKNYRNFVCTSCVEITEEIKMKVGKHLSNSNEVIDKLREGVVKKTKVIDSMEITKQTLQELLSDKDEIIRNQKEIIENMKKDRETTMQSLGVQTVNEDSHTVEHMKTLLQQCKEEIANLKKNTYTDSHVEELSQQLDSEKQINSDLTTKIENQAAITNQMENALKAKTELLDAKSDIIANLKTINQHLNKNMC